MVICNIDESQARAVLRILTEECAYKILDPRDADAFVRAIVVPQARGRIHDCREYRFIGALGFGGKFRNNGKHNGTPHVTCYREDETAARLQMIERANVRLAELFNMPIGLTHTPATSRS